MPYIIAMIVALILAAAKVIYDEREYKFRMEREWKRKWGTIPEEDYTQERMEALAKYFRMQNGKDTIDDITWNDLNMDTLYAVMNQTCCCAGEEYLYKLLRTPLFEEQELKERGRLAKYFCSNEKVRLQLQQILSRMGKLRIISFYEYIHKVDSIPRENAAARYYYPAGLLAAVASCFLIPEIGILLLVFFIGQNIYQYYKRKAVIHQYIKVFSYVIRLLGCVQELGKIKNEELQTYVSQAKDAAAALKPFAKGAWKLSFGKNMGGNLWDSILDYARMLFHIDLIQFNKMAKEIQSHPKEVEQLFSLTGFLDSMLAVASYRTLMGTWCEPVFLPGGSELSIDAQMMYHPLISNPQTNSILAEKSVLLTGANASGKSTFLKTVAVNAILAQTIDTVHATDYKTCFYRVFSSMSLRDDLIGNDSYYMVEIKSLKRIMDAVEESPVPVLCFVDEVLRGTNTLERIAASSRILYEITKKNILCFAATHDIELTHILEQYYDNYHFEEQVTNEDIVFDYQIKKGRAMTRNAIKLLGLLGYETSIINGAQNAVDDFLEKGVWDKM